MCVERSHKWCIPCILTLLGLLLGYILDYSCGLGMYGVYSDRNTYWLDLASIHGLDADNICDPPFLCSLPFRVRYKIFLSVELHRFIRFGCAWCRRSICCNRQMEKCETSASYPVHRRGRGRSSSGGSFCNVTDNFYHVCSFLCYLCISSCSDLYVRCLLWFDGYIQLRIKLHIGVSCTLYV